MRNFTVVGSDHSPEVKIDEQLGIIEIKSNSTSSNPDKFYKQHAKWVYAFNHSEQTTRIVNIKPEELDDKSSRWIFFLMRQIEQIFEQKKEELKINWICNPMNDSIVSRGIEYRTNPRVPFHIVAA